MLCHWVNGFWWMETWYIQTLRTTKPTTQRHTHSSMSTKTSKYRMISIALKQSYVSNWIKIIIRNAILLTRMCNTGLCTVCMSRSVDNCMTQCHLNLTFEHTKILLHQYYVLWYLERTPAPYSPCTVITLFTAVNSIKAPYRIWQVQKTFVYLQYQTAWHVIQIEHKGWGSRVTNNLNCKIHHKAAVFKNHVHLNRFTNHYFYWS
jgi:hypothetical protein